MPTLEQPRVAIPQRPETVFSTAASGWQQRTVRSMRDRRRFILETSCPSFDPSDTSAAALLPWLRGSAAGVASCHLPAAAGFLLLGAAALDPEPISRTLFAILGLLGVLKVLHVLISLLTARYTYRWRVAFNPDRRKYTWLAEPLD